MLLTSTPSAKMAPAELLPSGMCIMPRRSKISFAFSFANGEFAAPTQYLIPSGKFAATSSVMAKELAHGTRKSHGVLVQSSILSHPGISAASENKSHVCTLPAPNLTSSFATVDPTFPHPCTVKVKSLRSLVPSMASTTPKTPPITELAVATLVSTRLFLPAKTNFSPVASTK